uniref:Uncharacterized protein n=1 Tax=Hypotaenidia okinawae TaxID=2861861 RepID=A0A6G1RZF2_9GRUI
MSLLSSGRARRRRTRELQACQPHLSPWEGEQRTLETISRHADDKRFFRRSQHGFSKGMSCFTKWLHFCDDMTGLAGEGRAAGTACLGFREAFDTVRDHHRQAVDVWAGEPDNEVAEWLGIEVVVSGTEFG